jgi:hypothetical protein
MANANREAVPLTPLCRNSLDDANSKAGFFRDFFVVSQARSAFIGSTRSSSALVEELFEYGGHINAWTIEDELLDRLHRY